VAFDTAWYSKGGRGLFERVTVVAFDERSGLLQDPAEEDPRVAELEAKLAESDAKSAEKDVTMLELRNDLQDEKDKVPPPPPLTLIHSPNSPLHCLATSLIEG